jgi:hypothetical protein
MSTISPPSVAYRAISCKLFPSPLLAHPRASPAKSTREANLPTGRSGKQYLHQITKTSLGINTDEETRRSPYRFVNLDLRQIPESKTASNRSLGCKLRPKIDFLCDSLFQDTNSPVTCSEVRLSRGLPGGKRRKTVCPSLQRAQQRERVYARRASPKCRSFSKIGIGREEASELRPSPLKPSKALPLALLKPQNLHINISDLSL